MSLLKVFSSAMDLIHKNPMTEIFRRGKIFQKKKKMHLNKKPCIKQVKRPF